MAASEGALAAVDDVLEAEACPFDTLKAHGPAFFLVATATGLAGLLALFQIFFVN